MRRRLLNLLTVLSVLLCVTVMAVWALTYDAPRSVSVAARRGGRLGASSFRGSLVLWWESAGAMDVILLRDNLAVGPRRESDGGDPAGRVDHRQARRAVYSDAVCSPQTRRDEGRWSVGKLVDIRISCHFFCLKNLSDCATARSPTM